MGSNCSSALKKKDKDKTSIENGNQCGSAEQRRVSNISVESVAYGKESTNKQNNVDIKKLTNSETKTADTHKLIAKENTNSQSSSKFTSNTQDNSQQDNQQLQTKLNKCMSLNESSTSKENQQLNSNKQHSVACPTNSNPSNSSTSMNRPLRNCFDAVFTIESNRSFIILISNDRNELCIYNLKTGEFVRKLRNINRPKDVKLIDQYRAVVLCDRELIYYNLDECKLITKLKGVMPTKMPFYGLHDQHYAVTLSRNRMYVNMINLDTDNLETTFKVGEDRFLNSLLVSKNGKICVCGDETQKPFPLLVWDLKSRKLVYDLRIPNHEMITSLSAISNDGHFVACVCKETTSNSCNFIVVYDLQSGTLFKKFKSDFNTVSITISSVDNCVINGLENKQIQIWDLNTGAIRYVLEGHEAPVNKLIIADEGEFILSYDSTLVDKNIRVWKISTGTCIKSFAPDFELSCCTLSSNGNLLILCPSGQPDVQIVKLTDDDDLEDSVYGDPSRTGLEIDLNS